MTRTTYCHTISGLKLVKGKWFANCLCVCSVFNGIIFYYGHTFGKTETFGTTMDQNKFLPKTFAEEPCTRLHCLSRPAVGDWRYGRTDT